MTFFDKKYLNLLRELTISHIKMKDQSNWMGYLWSFLNPFLMLLILFTMFNLRFGNTMEHYGAFVLIGIVQYTHFVNATSAAMMVFRNMDKLTSLTIFPKEVLVFSIVLSRSIEFIIALVISILFAYISGVSSSWSILAIPIVILLQMVLVLWVSLLLSWVYLLVKDIQHIYQAFLRLLMFVSPIFYSLSFLDNNPIAQKIVMFNPLSQLINFTRTLIISGKLFSIQSSLWFLVANALLLFICYRLFKRVEPKFTELI